MPIHHSLVRRLVAVGAAFAVGAGSLVASAPAA